MESLKPNMLDSQPTARRQVWRISEDESLIQEIEVVLEEPLSLYLNGKQVAVLMRLPGMEKELAAGFCLSEGLVSRFTEVLTIHHCGQGLPSPLEDPSASAPESRNRVELEVRPEALREDARLEVARLIRAGCGAVDVHDATLTLPMIQGGPQVGLPVIFGLEKTMRAQQRLHQQVGGVHAAALFEASGELVVLAEDIGRHNAVDKVVGYCLLRDIPLADKLFLSSGRLSYEMVTKVIRLGIPLLLSVSAPTALAVQLAERFGVTLVGYLRGHKMTVYTHPERIISA
jgi:FdhD protein